MGVALKTRSTPDHRGRQLVGGTPDNSRTLDALGELAGADIETRFVGDLGRGLRTMFDPVTDATLPIYFGPLLGRLYLEGL